MTQQWKLIEVGAKRVTRDVEIQTPDDLLREVSKHLLSSEVAIDFDTEWTGVVCVGPFMREVGSVVRIDERDS